MIWSAANIAVKGSLDDVRALAAAINSLPGRPGSAEGDFGPFWLGNLVAVLGGDPGRIPCRGVLCPNPELEPCFSAPKPDIRERVAVGNDGILRFSVVMPYILDNGLLRFLKKVFPSVDFRYKVTDEEGSYHYRHDPDDILGDVAFSVKENDRVSDYRRDQREEFVGHVNRITGFRLGISTPDEEIADAFARWADSLPGDEGQWNEITIWKEI